MTLAVLIPAAGCSSRLGQSKQLVKIKGRPMLQNRIRLCSDVITLVNGKIFCVLGANAHQIRHQVIDPRCRFLFFPDWNKGLSHTIAYGIEQLPEQISAVLIMLSDQWAIEASDLEHLINCWQKQPDKLIASRYQDIIGVPAIFPRAYFEQLKTTDKNNNKLGAKAILQQNSDSLITINMAHAQQDLDTPKQLQEMQQQLQSNQSQNDVDQWA